MTAASGDPGETPPKEGGDPSPPPADPAYGMPAYPAYPAYGPPAGQFYPAVEPPASAPGPGYPGGYPPPPGYAAAPPPYYGGYPGYPGYPAAAPAGTNTLAIIAVVCSVLGLLCGVGSLVGVALGAVAISQIKKSGQRGHSLAVKAILVGAASLVLNIVMFSYVQHMG